MATVRETSHDFMVIELAWYPCVYGSSGFGTDVIEFGNHRFSHHKAYKWPTVLIATHVMGLAVHRPVQPQAPPHHLGALITSEQPRSKMTTW